MDLGAHLCFYICLRLFTRQTPKDWLFLECSPKPPSMTQEGHQLELILHLGSLCDYGKVDIYILINLITKKAFFSPPPGQAFRKVSIF